MHLEKLISLHHRQELLAHKKSSPSHPLPRAFSTGTCRNTKANNCKHPKITNKRITISKQTPARILPKYALEITEYKETYTLHEFCILQYPFSHSQSPYSKISSLCNMDKNSSSPPKKEVLIHFPGPFNRNLHT